jgi:2-dehydro-3-deoxygluconokinase
VKVVSIGEAMVELAPVGEGLFRRGFAGDTYNTAWHMAQLLGGRAEVGFATRVGQDSLSDSFVAGLQADGLSIAGVGRDAARTMGLYLIELDGVERRFHYWRSASAARALADDPAALGAAFEGAGLIHLSGITLAILAPDARARLRDALARARGQGARISFDPNIRPRLWSSPDEVREVLPGFLSLTDVILPSFDDEVATWGDADPAATVARYRAAGIAEIVVKNGAGAVTACLDGTCESHPTPPVTGIRDTTGAGDAFNAGYLAARLTGAGQGAAVARGQAIAAAVLQSPGARALPEKLAACRALFA